MLVLSADAEQEFSAERHVEKILARVEEGDVSLACWEPGQRSPYHCHPKATEIYLCLEGGGTMRTPDRTVAVGRGTCVVHPPGELHEYANGSRRTLLLRVRYGGDMAGRIIGWTGNANWTQSPEDALYFARQSPEAPR
jgi:quercetin dioxygenase-like cupin family protein